MDKKPIVLVSEITYKKTMNHFRFNKYVISNTILNTHLRILIRIITSAPVLSGETDVTSFFSN